MAAPPSRRAGVTVDPAQRRRTVAMTMVVATALVWIPGGLSRFVFAKLLLLACACVVGATVPRTTRLPRIVAVLLGLGAVIFAVAALTSSTPWSSVVGRWPRYEGLPVLGLYAASAWLGARLVSDDQQVHRLVTAVAGVAAALGALSVAEAIGWSPLGQAEVARPGSVLGNATDQGLVAMIFVLLLVVPTLQRPRELLVAGLTGAAATVVLSGSRTALVLSVVGTVAVVVLDNRDAARRRLVRSGVGVAAATAVAALAIGATRTRLFSSATVEGRWVLWERSWQVITDHWLWGIGPSRFADVFAGYEDAAWVRVAGTSVDTDSPHNWILQVWVAGGVAMLACALALVIITAVLGWRAVVQRPALAGVFVAVGAYGAAMLTGFTISTSTPLAAFLAGVLLARKDPGPEHPWTRPVAATTATVAAAALALTCVSEVYLRAGWRAANAGDAVAATGALTNATRLRFWDPDAAMLAGLALSTVAEETDTSVIDQGRAWSDRSLAATPDSYRSLIAAARLASLAADSASALALLDRAIDLGPQRPIGYTLRAAERDRAGDQTGAEHDRNRAEALSGS